MSSAVAALEETTIPATVVLPPLPSPGTPHTAPDIDYYKVDARRARAREWWRSTGWFTAVVAWVLGRLGVNVMASQRVPRPRDYRQLALAAEAVPGEVREKFATRTTALHAAGFSQPVFYHLVNRFNGCEEYAAIFIGPSGHTLARVYWSRSLPGGKVRGRFEVGFHTGFDDGSSVCTCDQPPRWDEPPDTVFQYRRGMTDKDLLDWHERSVAEHPRGARPALVQTTEQLWDAYNTDRQTHSVFYERRGLFVPPSPEEAREDAKVAGATNEAEAAGSPFGAAWAELQKAQAAKPGNTNGKLLLVLTLAAAATFGYRGVTGSALVVLLGVLLFHELGHYLAMRAFGYRNLKMFFLPGIGAAVAGRHYNVSGWKKAIVSLLGPLPGIWVGVALGAYASFADNALLGRIALSLLAVNVINLLPVVPLDGGWFWNAVLFSRAWWLETLFKAAAGACGIAAGAAGLGRLWLWLGIFRLVTLPGVWTQSRVTAALRRRGFATLATQEDTVPFATAETIFTELERASKGKLNPKNLASNTLQVFERLNAVPPNWLETFGLASMYFVSVAAAVVGLACVAMFHLDNATKLAATAKAKLPPEPPLVLDSDYRGGAERSPATQPGEHAPTRLLCAQFSSEPAARQCYERLVEDQLPMIELARFGRSVLVQAPARRNGPAQPCAELLTQAGATLHDTNQHQTWFDFNVAATATPTVAAETQRQLDLWLHLPPDLRPPAPWLAPSDAAVWRSCETYRRVQEAEEQARQDPAWLHRQQRAQLLGIFSRSRNTLARTQETMAALAQTERAAVEKLLATHDPALDDAVLAHALQRPHYSSQTPGDMVAWRAKLRQLLTHQVSPTASNRVNPGQGETSENGDDEDDEAVAPDYVSGEAQLAGDTVTLKHLHFSDAPRDLPALGEWLIASGFTQVQYGVQTRSMRDFGLAER